MGNSIAESWNENAQRWINIIASEGIRSRKFTNAAIVKTLLELPIKKILDCGCGEGWLTRSMIANEKVAVGIDATPALIEEATKKGPEVFFDLSYEDIIVGKKVPESPFDAVVFNFCLYRKEGTKELLEVLRENISQDGFVVIQTLHPFFLLEQGLPYESQWLQDSWKGLPNNFTNGHPWYARTFSDWLRLFTSSGFYVYLLEEVKNFEGALVSAIFVLKQTV